jgi:hypothetical protein
MKKLSIITAGAVLLAAVPATLGLTGNASFAQSVSVRVPSQAVAVQDRGFQGTHVQVGDVKGVHRSTGTAVAGEDKGGLSKKAVAGDDKGGLSKKAVAGDDKSGSSTHVESGSHQSSSSTHVESGSHQSSSSTHVEPSSHQSSSSTHVEPSSHQSGSANGSGHS